jgi:hypothetical protein
MFTGKTSALLSESRYSGLPRSVDWREIARELPAGPERDAALKRESAITRLLAEYWPKPAYWPSTSKRRKPWSVSWQHVDDVHYAPPDVPPIKDLIFHRCPPPFEMQQKRRSTDVNDDDYAGAVVARNGELAPRRHDSGPKVKRDVFDRFNAASSRMEEAPPQ